jgi:YD repeat-containing protein
MKPSRILFCFLTAFAAVSFETNLRAQVGNDNPTGPSGIFNGEISTGGSYDPYTGNAMRVITDIVVAGSVGAQPLALTRTYNSRYANAWVAFGFGQAGSWRHNYSWAADDPQPITSTRSPAPYVPISCRVSFPDGRLEEFARWNSSDAYYSNVAITQNLSGTYTTTPVKGIGDRFIPLDLNTGLAYLLLSDGSKVEFRATQSVTFDHDTRMYTSSYSYVPQAIIDRYQLRTTLTYSATDGSLQTVTEPAGRSLQFFYVGGYVDHVTSSDGRSVQYSYTQSSFSPGTAAWTWLDHVTYYGDAQWTARYTYKAPNVGDPSGLPLLATADDPMYDGPMKRIGYQYATGTNTDGSSAVYGQVLSENYYTGSAIGAAVTTLSVTGSTSRKETRADTKTRTFTYSSGDLTSCTDFRNVTASQTRDGNGYINSVTDRNGHTTTFTTNALTGRLQTVTYPATPNDTPPGTPAGTITYTYGGAGCADPNNQDANNPYYVCGSTDEGGHTTLFTRDSLKRVMRIDYPDGGYETFSYNGFNQVLTHVMKTGGTETFSYDNRGLKQTYRSPDNPSGNPTATYGYDAFDRVSMITDVFGSALNDALHTTSYSYNARHQQTVLTRAYDDSDNARHTVSNAYNPDGTLQSTTDELGHVTSYTYDDYKRLRTKVTPQRSPGDNTPRTTSMFYDQNGNSEDYSHTDANVTHTILPSTKKITTAYDENYRKSYVIAGDGTSDAAKTSYGYDNVGNLTSVMSPKEQPGQVFAGQSTVTGYDERNRVMIITDALNHQTSLQYDGAGRKYKITRPNGQVTTFDIYDNMNRLLQQTVKQSPDPDAVTKYTYYTSGLLHTFQDPKLSGGTDNYSYSYDQMGRKTGLTYPLDSANAHKSEAWHYDIGGRNDSYTNRAGNVETIVNDALYRLRNTSWNDGVTPATAYTYDGASRLTGMTNTNSTIARAYYDDNLLKTETTTLPGDNVARTLTYTYDADGNRKTIDYPNSAYSFTYGYTNRNQLNAINNTVGGAQLVGYAYDPDGNLTSRTPNNSTSSTFTYDALDRTSAISHAFAGANTRTFAYGYDSVGNRTWTKRDGGNGDVFGYDLADQATSILLNVASPDTAAPGPQTIVYDANGNRTTFGAYGTTDTYATNNLNEYTSRNANQAVYNANGCMTTGIDTSGGSGGGPNLVGNAGFENGLTNISPWTASGNCKADNYTTPHSGSYYFGFNAGQTTPNGVVSQVINTTPGTNYTITFWQGIFVWNQTATQRITATVKNSANVNLVGPTTFAITATAGTTGVTQWQQQSLTFTADGTTATIQFADNASNPTMNTDLLLDDVSVTITSTANLMTNGGFENGTANISPWSKTGNCNADNYTTPHSGSYYFGFNAGQTTPNGVVSQVVNTTPGTSYTLTFWHGIFVWNQTATQRITATVKNASNANLAGPFTFSTTATAGTTSVTQWQQETITFTADGSSITIQFADNAANPTTNTDLLLDDVSLTAAGGGSSGPSTYTYDGQNRLLTATKNGTTETFTYDAINRQVSRKIGAAAAVYNVYDGWDLIAEYSAGSSIASNAYLYGAGGLVKNLSTNSYYYQDASGSTSHLANSSGTLVEWYRYDLHGTPIFYNASNTQISGSNYGVRHLFTGQQWYSELGLYNLRSRFYSPDILERVQGLRG